MPDKSDEIFLLKGDSLEPMGARTMREGLLGVTMEAALQRFFEKYPQIIPGKQIDPGSDDPPRFALLRREMPIGGWSLDHLLVDQRGILTLVETKLFENPEARREVIGQIIEYAANAKESWGQGQAKQRAADYWGKQGRKVDEVLREAFDPELDIEAFWASIEENLKDGRIRLIIASDELRPEVRRMLEYLNGEMENAEVLGLELKCYGKGEAVVLVPRITGQMQTTIDRKGKAQSTVWLPSSLSDSYAALPDQNLGQRLLRVLNWAVEKNLFVKGVSQRPSFGVQNKTGMRMVSFDYDGTIYILLNYANNDQYLGGMEGRQEFARDLKKAGLLDSNVDPAEVVSGRNASKKLQDMSEAEVSSLLEIFSKHGEPGRN